MSDKKDTAQEIVYGGKRATAFFFETIDRMTRELDSRPLTEEDYTKFMEGTPDFDQFMDKLVEKLSNYSKKHIGTLSILYDEEPRQRKKRNAFIDDIVRRYMIDEWPSIIPLNDRKRSALEKAAGLSADMLEDREERFMSVYDGFETWELVALYEFLHPQGTAILPSTQTVFGITKMFSSVLVGRLPEGMIIQEGTGDKENELYFIQAGKNTTTIFTLKDKTLFLASTEAGKTKRGSRKDKSLIKFYTYFLQVCNDQNFHSPVLFDIHDLVDEAHMYKDYKSAKKAFIKYMPLIYKGLDYTIQTIRGTTITESSIVEGMGEGHGFISRYSLPKGTLTAEIYIDNNFDLRTLTEFYTLIPTWAFSLNPNAFLIVWYIFYIARQNCGMIAKEGYFNIGLDTLRGVMGLPALAKDGKDYIRIKEPIVKALGEVEAKRIANNDKNIIIDCSENENTEEWLRTGRLQVELSGSYRNYFSEREKARAEKLETVKQEATKRKRKNKK